MMQAITIKSNGQVSNIHIYRTTSGLISMIITTTDNQKCYTVEFNKENLEELIEALVLFKKYEGL